MLKEKKTLTGTLPLFFCLNHSSSVSTPSFFQAFKLLNFQEDVFKQTNISGSIFTNGLDRRIYKTKFPTHVCFLSSIFYYS